MRPLYKTSLAAALFLIPLWLVCREPSRIEPELVPLPFKAQGGSKSAAKINDLKPQKTMVLIAPVEYAYNPEIPPPSLRAVEEVQKMKRLSFNYGALEVQDRDAVRLKGAKVGINYHVDEKQSVSVESSQQIYDRQDAKAWGKGGQDESTAGIKYKLKF